MYLFSKELEVFFCLALKRLARNLGCVLLLEGPPGGGKSSFAQAIADKLGCQRYYYSCNPDKERNLLYEIDVQGVLKRENAWVPGPAWQAFADTANGKNAVLLIDEVDKANGGFDSFLLRLLEDWTFRAPSGEEVKADPGKLVVVLTSNGRRQLRPEVLRRCQRINIPLPSGERMVQIINQIAGQELPQGLVNLLIRLSDDIRKAEEDQAPSPKELALCGLDLLELAAMQVRDGAVWRQVAASWLVKHGGPKMLDKVCANKFDWARALRSEAQDGLKL